MPRTGTPTSKTAASHMGAPGSDTLFGPPERMMPAGRLAAIFAAATSGGQISEYTESSRSRLAMSCVYWDPKSRTMMVWWLTDTTCLELVEGVKRLAAIITGWRLG